MNKAPEKFLRPTFSSTNEKGMQSSEDHRDPTKSEKERKFRRNLQNFDAAPSRSVVLRDLPFCCTSKDLQNFIAEHLGVPPDVAVVLRNPDGKTLQYGCALFSSDEHAAQALERVHLRRLHGRDIRVLPYSSAALREVSRSGDVLISFISLSAMVESITEQNIRNIVEEYGDIDYIAIRHHKFSKEGMQNGFGFVTMTSQEENRRVLDNVKGIEVDNVIYTSEESNQLRRGQPKTVDPDQLDDASEAAHVPSPLKAQKSIDSDKLSSSSVKTDTSQVSPRAENTPNEVTMHQQSPVPDNIRSSAAISRPSSRTNISREPIISTAGPSSHPNYPSSYHQSGTPYQQSIAQNQTIVVDPSSNTYHHPALMTYQPPRPYSPSSISASSNSHNQTYISSISSHHMQGNPSVGGSPVLSSMSGQMLTSYPTQPPQFSAPYPPGVPVYSTGQPQQSVPSYHSPQMNASAHNRYHVAPPLQYSMAVNVPQAQPLPPQSLNSPPGYQYAMPMDSNPPTYVMSTFPHSSQQGSPAHAPPSSSNPHQHHLPLVPRHQPSSSPYLHVAVPQNGMNVPVVSIVPVPSAQSHHVSTYPNGQLMTPSSVAPNNASVSYPLQYSNQTNAYHMGHHAMQTPIYQQQHHHPQFVSQPQPNHSTHAYHHHPPQQDQQRR